MASATWVACNKEGDGNSGKSNGEEGGGQETATRAMATWLGIPIFGSNFCDPHRKQNSDSVSDLDIPVIIVF
jgi:hypothetical protein